jgi:VCBS repeat-containing protein
MKLNMTTKHTNSAPGNHALGVAKLSALASALLLASCAVTPDPLGLSEGLSQGQADQKTLTEATQAPTQTITLAQAMARALLHNRERRVQMMESAMAANQLSVSRFDMLPQLAANAGYTQRDRLAASSSGVLDTNGQISRSDPPTYSVSAAKQSETANLLLSWNILDFGLSYMRANQAADRLLIAKERERKAVNNLIQDVRSAYWRAISAQKLLKQTAHLRQRVQQALVDSRRVESMRLKNPMEALSYQRDLLDVRRSLESLYKDLLDARTTLATLMGLPPSTVFELQELNDADYKVPELKADMATLERSALALRPELMELRYQKRITESEGRAALLSLLPGLSLNTGVYKDTNDYLLYNNWTSHGATLGLNLFNVLKAPSVNDLSNAQKRLAHERRLALTAAVLGQVHLSRVALDNAKDQYETSHDYLQVVRKIRAQVSQMRTAERSGELDLIREEMAELLADLRKDVAYAELQNSYGRIFVSAGLDPLPSQQGQVTETSLSKAMQDKLNEWDTGYVGIVLKPLSAQVTPWSGPGAKSLKLEPDTFSLAGQVKYEAKQANGDALPSWLKFDPKTQTFSGNPPAGKASYALEVAAMDSSGAKIADKFVLQLDKVNDAPQTGVQKTISAVEGSKPLQGKLDAVDPDGDPLTFSLSNWQKKVPGFSFQPDGQWQFDPADPDWKSTKAGDKRQATMRFTATDPHGETGTLTLVIEVTGVNNPPEVETPAEVKLDNNASAMEGNIRASDVDQDAKLVFEVLGDKSPDGFTLKTDGRWRFEPTHQAYKGLKKGEFRSLFVPIKVADEMGGMAVARLQITVNGTQP